MERPMVFVLGAGASMPYGYPSGRGLVENIISPSPDIRFFTNHADFQAFQKRLTNSQAPSVDTFLGRDSKGTFEQVGKLAIAETLLHCESYSRLFRDKTDDDWYPFVFNTMLAKIRRLEEVRHLPLSFVTFNYDRSLEQFIYVYLTSNFPDSTPEEVATVVADIPIVHVYGWLGPLDWQEPFGRPYGEQATLDSVLMANAAKRIAILHQSKDDSPEFATARELFETAHSIWLLGFGYHPENMSRLRLPFDRLLNNGQRTDFHIFGTVYGKTAAETSEVVAGSGSGHWKLGSGGHKITDALRNNALFLECMR
jgi:hypothetical protein